MRPGDTAGDLIKSLRTDAMDKPGTASSASMFMADKFETMTRAVPPFLNLVSLAHQAVGAAPLEGISGFLNRASGHIVPKWNPHMPRGAAPLQPPLAPAPAPAPAAREIPRKVVYMPSCVTRMMGPSLQDTETEPVHAKLLSILSKVCRRPQRCAAARGPPVRQFAQTISGAQNLICAPSAFCALCARPLWFLWSGARGPVPFQGGVLCTSVGSSFEGFATSPEN